MSDALYHRYYYSAETARQEHNDCLLEDWKTLSGISTNSSNSGFELGPFLWCFHLEDPFTALYEDESNPFDISTYQAVQTVLDPKAYPRKRIMMRQTPLLSQRPPRAKTYY
jgi:hypothetical protein